jgi:hypothetical protein
LLYGLPHAADHAGFEGLFGWPPVHGNRTITTSAWRKYLRDLYARGERGSPIIAAAFPKFHDIYQQAGLHDSYGYLDDREGKTFDETLALAWKSTADLVQVVTWNDYGEGTIVEPTREFGYRYLEAIQLRVTYQASRPFPFKPADLRLPIQLYKLRKQFARQGKSMDVLDRVSSLLFSAECDAARILLQNVQAR